jgi:CrcB protein
MPSNDQPDPSAPRDQHPPMPPAPAGRILEYLPVDSDVDSFPPSAGSEPPPLEHKSSRERAAHYQLGLIGLVFIGGAFGALSRSSLTHLVGSPGGFPVSTLVENVVGAFLLGVLLEALSRRGPDHGKRRRLRLLLGTGFLGGFTTYSSFAVEAVHLLDAGETLRAILYLGLTILVGAAASFVGIWCAATQHQHRHPPSKEPDHQSAPPSDRSDTTDGRTP